MIIAENEMIEKVKVLAEAASMQARVANRTWLGLLTIAALTLLPRGPKAGQPCEPVLPLGLGPVDPFWYYPTLFMILVILTIAVAVAQAQVVRVQKLAQSFLRSLAGQSPTVLGMEPRELYDMIRLPSLNRVAPLAQFLLGEHQFHATSSGRSRQDKIWSEIAYLPLRLVSMAVFYLLPTFALWHAFSGIHVGPYAWVLSGIGGSIAWLALVAVCYSDIQYSVEVMGIIWAGGTPVQGPPTQAP